MRPARNIHRAPMPDKGASYVPAVLPVFHVYEGEGMVKALVRRRTIDDFAEGAPMAFFWFASFISRYKLQVHEQHAAG